MNHRVLILTGPGGAGKTTIAELLEKEYGYIFVDGDNLDSEFFPDGGQWLAENLELLKKAHDKILAHVKEKYDKEGNNIVLDYIIFGDYLNFINKFKKEFRDNLSVKVLLPAKTEVIKRDKERECWTTGEERINAVYKEFEDLKPEIGEENYLDTTRQSSKETAKSLLNS